MSANVDPSQVENMIAPIARNHHILEDATLSIDNLKLVLEN